MKIKGRNGIRAEIAVISLLVIWSCTKDYNYSINDTGFILSSSEIGADSLLPVDYTCDGVSATLPLMWTGAPEKTASFAIIMHHVASPTDVHWYWVLYNIPATIKSLPRNVTGIGTLGTNSVNDGTGYSPPCSQGPGLKAYTYTLYALSRDPSLSVTSDQVNREALLNAIEGITISRTKMTVYYSRISL
jgi:phosphatidylethanolamine-binding protein (PEBP) family uncharacterized protein